MLTREFTDVVFYLFGTDPRTDEFGPCGSGVFVVRDFIAGPDHKHMYAVTAHHAAMAASHIRVNTKNDKSRLIPVDDVEWVFVPQGNDVAVLDITDRLNLESDCCTFLPEAWMLTDDRYASMPTLRNIIGQGGFMLGLFALNPGNDVNLPAARFGRISQLASKHGPIKQGHGLTHPSHVFDIRSRPGFSGSPVFVYSDLEGTVGNVLQDGTIYLGRGDGGPPGMLGIHSGQFPEVYPAKLLEGPRAKPGLGISAEFETYIPSSMTVIVPAQAIKETLSMKQLDDKRRERETRMSGR